jgi:thioredoxin 1
MIELTDDNIDHMITSDERPIVVDVWATWCAPCKAMISTLEELEAEFGDDVRFGKIDMETAPLFVNRAGVRALPTLIFYDRGVPVAMKAGASRKDDVRKWLNAMLGK